ncbi:MAG: HAMP domain-containing histidine kinase [Bdellovibrionaceae bacterium]|nr:HAMP domain-containing histidine kinase [Pseudobdellovibrionaceae bacterium]
MRGFLSFLFLACGATLVALALYALIFSPQNSWSFRLAWLPVLGVFVAFWADHNMLRKQNSKLARESRTKADFISVLTHDLKTPLARIKAMAEVISNDASALTYEQKQALAQLDRSQYELTSFIDDIVQMSRLEGGSLKLNLQTSDINQVITTVVRESQFAAVDRNIEVAMELEPLFSFKFDRALIKQVIQNLVENALKYSHSHSRVLISTEDKDRFVVMQISDEGIGIPAKDLPFIFDRYYRSSEAKSFAGGSSGLGLYLCKAFTGLHGGTLDVKSKEGQGTTFTLTLPKGDRRV